MKTSIYINRLVLNKLINASKELSISKNILISILLARIADENAFQIKLYKTVQYQRSDPDIDWVTEHVKFEPVTYEKAQDLRMNFKFSVSWFIAFAIVNYLDDVLKKLADTEDLDIKDNYGAHYVYIAKTYGKIQGFTRIWGLPEKKYLEHLII